MYCGIYKITNKISGQIYIGQSSHIEQRWKEHMNDRGGGASDLHNDFNKFGITNFTFEIIEICNLSELDDCEMKWINFYNSYNEGYNKTKGGQTWSPLAAEINKKEIYCYDLDGNFLKKYNSLSDAERDLNINNSNISRAARTQGRTENYQWSYSYVEKLPPYKRKCFTGKQTKGKLIKKVNQYDKNFNYIATYGSIALAAEATGANASCIGEICKTKGQGNRKTSGGFIWRFEEDDNLSG